MSSNSGLALSAFNPQIGDWIRVYHDSNFEIEMKVAERRWRLTNGRQWKLTNRSNPELHCWLTSPNGMDLINFEDVLKQHGFSS